MTSPGTPRIGALDQILLAAAAAVSTYLLIGDFGVRLANTSGDDGLVAYAYLYKYPERFAQDAHMLSYGRGALASALNWLPAALFKYAEVPPEAFFWTFAFLQNILLALAVYRLAMVMVQSRETALIAAVFTLTFQPHWWNMGIFGDLNWMPYGAWSGLPFFVLAGAFALELRLAASAIALLAGGLVHPILGLFAAAMLGGYWSLLVLKDDKLRALAAPLAVLGATAVVFLLPVALVKSGFEEVPAAEILPILLSNDHAVPWGNPSCAHCMPWFVKSMVVIPVLTGMSLFAAVRWSLHPRLVAFLGATTGVALAASVLHFTAYFAQSATLLRLVSSRSTILLLVFALPPFVWLAWTAFSRSRSYIARFVAGYVLAWPSAMGLVAALLVLPTSVEPQNITARPAIRLLAAMQVAGILVLAVVLIRYVPEVGTFLDTHVLDRVVGASFIPYLFGFPSSRFHTLVVLYLCSVLGWQALSQGRVALSSLYHSHAAPQPLALALIAPLTAYLIGSSYMNGQIGTSGEAREYYEVQAWARSSTAPDATFIVEGISLYDAWRSFTHRGRITARGCGYYVCTRAGQKGNSKVAEFIAKFGDPYGPAITRQGLEAFARTYGGDYAVRRRNWPSLDFPVAFQNGAYVVYDLR